MSVKVHDVYCIETFDGEILMHPEKGPLIFFSTDDAEGYIAQKGLAFSVSHVPLREDRSDALVHYAAKELLNLPKKGAWLRDFRDAGFKVPGTASDKPPAPKAKPEPVADKPVEEPAEEPVKMTKDQAQAKAEELGIHVDKRWGIKRLLLEIEQAAQPA